MNNQPEIPKSKWVLERVYFTARVVKDFKERMIDYHQDDDGGLDVFCERIQEQGVIEMYQFPEEDSLYASARVLEEDHNYFEMEDDNWVIPRELFVVLG